MYCISSVTDNIKMEVPHKILIYTFSATLAYNGISITIVFKAPALECIFCNIGLQVFSEVIPLLVVLMIYVLNYMDIFIYYKYIFKYLIEE